MLKIELFDTVKLIDGRVASIIDVLSDTDFDADVGNGPANWETITISINDISHKIDTNSK